MTKEDIEKTEVWRVNKTLVVASTIQDAIEIYKTWVEYPYNDIERVEKVYDGGTIPNNNALIKL